jgi:hypothetical protein
MSKVINKTRKSTATAKESRQFLMLVLLATIALVALVYFFFT